MSSIIFISYIITYFNTLMNLRYTSKCFRLSRWTISNNSYSSFNSCNIKTLIKLLYKSYNSLSKLIPNLVFLLVSRLVFLLLSTVCLVVVLTRLSWCWLWQRLLCHSQLCVSHAKHALTSCLPKLFRTLMQMTLMSEYRLVQR